MPSSLLQVVNSLFQTCYNKLGTSSANTTCRQLVNRLVTTCLQTCYNLCVFTCVARLCRPVLNVSHAKISHLVASLPTSRQQVVFALLVPSYQQVCNKLLTACNKLVDIIRLVTRLFQQVRYSHDITIEITILLKPCVVTLVTFSLYHDCIRLVRTTL
jgi:hypothetical protein